MLRKNRILKYSFETEEEFGSSSSTKSGSQWERKLQRIKDKGPEALEAFHLKENERLRAIRKNFSEEQKLRIRELQRKRQAEYRKRKAEKEGQTSTRGSAEKKKSEEAARKEKRREYVRQWRKNASEEKRKELNERRRAQYHLKKMTAEAQNPVIVTEAAKDQQPAVCQQPKSPGSPFKSPAAKRKAASRAKEREPVDPMKYAELKVYQLKQALKSPRKRACLSACGFFNTEHVSTAVKRKIVTHLSFLKEDTSKKSRLERKIPAEKEELAGNHGNGLPKEVVTMAKDFFQRPESSIMLPDRKMIKKDLVPKQCLTKSLKNLHQDFTKVTGEQMSLSKFKSLRPQHVLTVDKLKRTSCVCKVCANVAQKMKALKPLLLKANISLETDVEKVIERTICQGKDRISRWLCLTRTCDACGVHKLSKALDTLPRDEIITWQRWQLTGQQMMDVTKQGSIDDLLTELLAEVAPLASHLGVATWQYHEFRQLKTNMLPGHLLTLMDFAENYRCIHQQEVQSAHWSYNQATVFPTVNYYRCTSCDQQVKESVVIISQDLQHDASAVHLYNSLVVDHLQQKRGIAITKQFQFTDGAASQFMSREPFMDIAMSMADFNFPIERSFFGSSHGKGPCDGVGGIVKAAARQAVVSERALIRNAAEMYQYLEVAFSDDPSDECHHSRRVFLYVDRIPRPRSGRRPQTAVKGTRKLHNIKPCGETLLHRELSCYCEECVSGRECAAMKQFQQGRWKTHKFPSCAASHPPQLPETTAADSMEDPAPSLPDVQISTADAAAVKLVEVPAPSLPHVQISTADAAAVKLVEDPTPSLPHVQISTADSAAVKLVEDPAPSIDKVQEITKPCPDYKDVLASLAEVNDWKSLEVAAAAYNRLLPPLKPEKMTDYRSFDLKADQPSISLYPSDGPTDWTPFSIYGDGNCLPRCGSLLAFGTQERHIEMRLRIALELVLHKQLYTSDEDAHFCAMYSDVFVAETLNAEIMNNIYEKAVKRGLKSSTYMGMWHLKALVSVLQRPIFSIYPEYGGFNVRKDLHKTVSPRTAGTDDTCGMALAGIMWTHTQGRHMPAVKWSPNHFVVCLPNFNIKPGDFALVSCAPGNTKGSTEYVAQITGVTADGGWGFFLKEVSPGKWKCPQKCVDFFIPQTDVVRVFRGEDYVMSMDSRAVVYEFTL